MSNARNAPCPCGSGKKFKRCCGAAGMEPLPEMTTEEVEAQGEAPNTWLVPLAMFMVAIGAGVGVGTWRQSVADGASLALALALLVIGYLMVRNPPSSTGRGGGAAIDYGMNRRKGPRRPPNRSQRRR